MIPTLTVSSTSYVESQNLTMRMGMRRFKRLTNGFSKKVENHAHAISLHFMQYTNAAPDGRHGAGGGIVCRPAGRRWRASDERRDTGVRWRRR